MGPKFAKGRGGADTFLVDPAPRRLPLRARV